LKRTKLPRTGSAYVGSGDATDATVGVMLAVPVELAVTAGELAVEAALIVVLMVVE